MVGQLVSVSISVRQVARYLSQLIELTGKPKKLIYDIGSESISKTMFFQNEETYVELGSIELDTDTEFICRKLKRQI